MNTEICLHSISVLIITYNQEDVIGRALDSVLSQKDWGLKEIVICDDCSTDNNWTVIQKYADKYPNIIRAFQNNPNLGIYGNMEKLVSLRGESELYHILSGDDAFCEGYFEATQTFIAKKNINLTKAISIYADDKSIKPNGKARYFHNNKAKNLQNAFRYKLRGLLDNRPLLITAPVINSYKHVILDQGLHLAEELFDFQASLYSDENYYNPVVGTFYYSRIGISTKMRTTEYYQQAVHKFQTLPTLFDLHKKDVYYYKMYQCYYEFLIHPKLKKIFEMTKYFFKSIDFSIGLSIKHLIIMWREIFMRLINKK